MMKRKLIETEKARVLVVDLPQGATRKLIISNLQVDNDLIELTGNAPRFLCSLPPGTWLPAGFLGKVPEEVAAKIAEKTDNPYWYGQGKPFIDYSTDVNCFETATESVHSLVAANVKLENPLWDAPPEFIEPETESDAMEIADIALAWLAEEETVYRNPHIFYSLNAEI